ncbi:MAG TPA: hypothetical protein VFM05_06055 [Candidatus Saccharimonadales bacterium]|nr:hypothetical protein [Candidatus Saccharimonadales bacterium]
MLIYPITRTSRPSTEEPTEQASGGHPTTGETGEAGRGAPGSATSGVAEEPPTVQVPPTTPAAGLAADWASEHRSNAEDEGATAADDANSAQVPRSAEGKSAADEAIPPPSADGVTPPAPQGETTESLPCTQEGRPEGETPHVEQETAAPPPSPPAPENRERVEVPSSDDSIEEVIGGSRTGGPTAKLMYVARQVGNNWHLMDEGRVTDELAELRRDVGKYEKAQQQVKEIARRLRSRVEVSFVLLSHNFCRLSSLYLKRI